MMRPPIWIGHVSLRVNSLDDAVTFYKRMGLRFLFKSDTVSGLELRGGTHLILVLDEKVTASDARFDFMVENLDESYDSFNAQGLSLSEITRGDIHDSFELKDPTGNRVVVNSTHVDDHALV